MIIIITTMALLALPLQIKNYVYTIILYEAKFYKI